MDRNAIAKELGELGREEARITKHIRQQLRRVSAIQARRCELLSLVACHKDAGLEPEVAAAAAGPKTEPTDG